MLNYTSLLSNRVELLEKALKERGSEKMDEIWKNLNELKNISDNCLDLSISCSAVLIGLVAFVYPQIFETKRKLKDISEVYVAKYERYFFIEHYISILSIMLCFSIVSSIFCIWENNIVNCCYILCFNILLVISGCFISTYVYYILDKYYNKPERQFKIDEIVRTQKANNNTPNDLDLIETLVARNINNRYDVYNIKKYLDILKEVFLRNMEYFTELDKKTKYKELGKWWAKTNYLYRPLSIIQYLNQEASLAGNFSVASSLMRSILDILKVFLSKNKHSSLYTIEDRISSTFKSMMIYRIINNKLLPDWDMNLLLDYYNLLLEYDRDHEKSIINGNLLNPNENVFRIMSYLIDTENTINFFKPWLSYSSNYIFMSMPFISDVQRLNCSLLAYMIAQKKYLLAYDYMFWQQPQHNARSISACQIVPTTLRDIISCFIKEDTIFKENKVFEKNEDARIYKIYVLFLLIHINYQHKQNDETKSYYAGDIIEKNIFEKFSNKSIFFNYALEKLFENDFDKFIQQEELLKIFYIDNIKKLKQILYSTFDDIKKILKEKQKKLLQEPLSGEDKNQFILEWLDECNNFITKALNPIKILSLKEKISNVDHYNWKNYPLKKILKETEKKKLIIATDYALSNVFKSLSSKLYTSLLTIIEKKCIQIQSFQDVNIDKRDASWIVISNYGFFPDLLIKMVGKDNIIYEEKNIVGIKINNQKVFKSKLEYQFHVNPPEDRKLFIIDTSKIKIKEKKSEVNFKEKSNASYSQNCDFSYSEKDLTNKAIEITCSLPFSIYFAENEIVGYYISEAYKI